MTAAPLTFSVTTGLSRLMQGAKVDLEAKSAETFLFRVRRVRVEKVPSDLLNDAGLNPATNPFVFFLVGADEWEEPGEELTGPLTFPGALAVARSFTENFDRLTNYGAF